MEVGSNILVNIISSVIFESFRYIVAKKIGRKSIDLSKEQKLLCQEVYKNFPEECLQLKDNGVVEKFINSPQTIDLINEYVLYEIVGTQQNNIKEIKNNKKVKNILYLEDIIEYLTCNLIKTYEETKLFVPEKRVVEKLFCFIIDVLKSHVLAKIDTDLQSTIFLINTHSDFLYQNLERKMSGLYDNIKILLKEDVLYTEEKYEEIRKEYSDILKTKFSEAHIYLLDKFAFNKFYVPPVLQKNYLDKSLKSDIFDELRVIYSRKAYMNQRDVKWSNIFLDNNIVYIIGGVGYGKTLFMQKLINDYQNIEGFHSEDYLVIYGELKAFYQNNSETPISVPLFLRNSMQVNTLMSDKKISVDFIEHYLKTGRCLILLDALDEVDKTKREELHSSIIAFFKNQNPSNKVCITSRSRGFIPEKEIEVFEICKLDETQIDKYIDNIIGLGKFDKSDKEIFMKQAKKLIHKGFLTSFLVLSLLINIFKAERELPENKLELYQKCFEYIANRRERKQNGGKYNWNNIMPLMKDSTFIELSKLCLPNNHPVNQMVVKEELIKIYKGKYPSEADTENAIDEFLKFCDDRTELFVPASADEAYKFFHRSFFEYFYSKNILRYTDEKEILKEFKKFDVDSEIFELTIALLKQTDELRYQKLVELILNEAKEELTLQTKIQMFNVLVLAMQVVDDATYIREFVNMLIDNREILVKESRKISNVQIITQVCLINNEYSELICSEYYYDNMFSVLELCIDTIEKPDIDLRMNMSKSKKFDINMLYTRHLFFNNIEYKPMFNLEVFIKYKELRNVLDNLTDSEIEQIYSKKCSKKKYNKKVKMAKNFLNTYKGYNSKKKDKLCELLKKVFWNE